MCGLKVWGLKVWGPGGVGAWGCWGLGVLGPGGVGAWRGVGPGGVGAGGVGSTYLGDNNDSSSPFKGLFHNLDWLCMVLFYFMKPWSCGYTYIYTVYLLIEGLVLYIKFIRLANTNNPSLPTPLETLVMCKSLDILEIMFV